MQSQVGTGALLKPPGGRQSPGPHLANRRGGVQLAGPGSPWSLGATTRGVTHVDSAPMAPTPPRASRSGAVRTARSTAAGRPEAPASRWPMTGPDRAHPDRAAPRARRRPGRPRRGRQETCARERAPRPAGAAVGRPASRGASRAGPAVCMRAGEAYPEAAGVFVMHVVPSPRGSRRGGTCASAAQAARPVMLIGPTRRRSRAADQCGGLFDGVQVVRTMRTGGC
jgi:hypothetical protein